MHLRDVEQLEQLGGAGCGATPADCGCFAIAKSNIAGFEYQYGGGTKAAHGHCEGL
jgi:hypothetical protein